MAYSNYNNPRGSYNNRGQQNSGWRGEPAPKPVEPLPIPDDYIDQAEKIMAQLASDKNITTSKLRSILTLISDIYNVELSRQENELTPESASKLQMARVRIAYECGRESSVKLFAEKTNILRYIKSIGTSRGEFIKFARYMEALVAYHRYFGGND